MAPFNQKQKQKTHTLPVDFRPLQEQARGCGNNCSVTDLCLLFSPLPWSLSLCCETEDISVTERETPWSPLLPPTRPPLSLSVLIVSIQPISELPAPHPNTTRRIHLSFPSQINNSIQSSPPCLLFPPFFSLSAFCCHCFFCFFFFLHFCFCFLILAWQCLTVLIPLSHYLNFDV